MGEGGGKRWKSSSMVKENDSSTGRPDRKDVERARRGRGKIYITIGGRGATAGDTIAPLQLDFSKTIRWGAWKRMAQNREDDNLNTDIPLGVRGRGGENHSTPCVFQKGKEGGIEEKNRTLVPCHHSGHTSSREEGKPSKEAPDPFQRQGERKDDQNKSKKKQSPDIPSNHFAAEEQKRRCGRKEEERNKKAYLS